jgi:hypothetical protein
MQYHRGHGMPPGNARWNPYAGYPRNGPDTLASEGRPYGTVGAASGIGLGSPLYPSHHPRTLATEGYPYGWKQAGQGLGFSVPGWAQGLLDGAGAVFGDPLLGQQVAVGGVVVGSLIPGGGNATDQGRLARCNIYLAGALAGIVDSCRYLIGTSKEDRPNAELAYYATAMAKVQAARPDVWAAAVAAGPLDDGQTPGYNGLRLLLANGMGINIPGMGTFDGVMVPGNVQLVQQLQTLAANPKTPPLGNIPAGALIQPGTTALPATPLSTAAAALGLGSVSPVVLLGGAALLVFLLMKKK